MKKQWIETINNAWEDRELLNDENTQQTIHQIIEEVDKGRLRVAEKLDTIWQVNDWVKKPLFFISQFRKWRPWKLAPLNFMIK